MAAPPYVKDYNKNMGGIDVADKISTYYNCFRRSKKCYRRLLFNLLTKFRFTTRIYLNHILFPHHI